ncbi:hypothetical protein UCRNP2_6592 [Neofusicoccum parvum UCRNP2]|uniref:Uncharacterized protein n=1 Tax=Botryosphaeria parva (strain UCR-NP2) TaxID=1287680 RepID=R1GL05_BOTPV|nr:hypothetical protein UCRNP2_6592 [Neofusicoccum parvum UCRNP2]
MDSHDNDIVMSDSPNNGTANHSLADFYRARLDLCPVPRIDSMENNDQNSITSMITDEATLPITGDAALSVAAKASDNAMHDLHQHRTAAFIATSTLEGHTGETGSISSGMRPDYADHVISDLTASKHLKAERAKKAKSHLDEARDMLNETLISRNTAPILPPSLTSSAQQFRYLEGIKVSIVRNKAARQREEETLFNEMQEMVKEEVRDLEVVRVQSSSLGCSVSKGYLLGQWQAYEEIKDQLDCPSANGLLEPIFSKLRIILKECSEV